VPTDTQPALHDLDVIAAVRGARSGQATYIAETLFRHFWTDLGQDGVLSMVLLLMDQRWDLRNYLQERIMQGFLSDRPCRRSFQRSLACWTNSVRSSSRSDWLNTPKWAGPDTTSMVGRCPLFQKDYDLSRCRSHN